MLRAPLRFSLRQRATVQQTVIILQQKCIHQRHDFFFHAKNLLSLLCADSINVEMRLICKDVENQSSSSDVSTFFCKHFLFKLLTTIPGIYVVMYILIGIYILFTTGDNNKVKGKCVLCQYILIIFSFRFEFFFFQS